MVSYHKMFNLYKVYEGDKLLKMYPISELSEQCEKMRIVHDYEKTSLPSCSSVASPTQQPPPLHLDSTPLRKQNLAVKATKHGPPPKKRNL